MTVTHWVNIGTALAAALVVAIGWIVSAYMAAAQRRAEARTAYLVEAYDDLALSSNRLLTPEYARMLETAVAKIQLYGNEEEIAAVNHLLDTWERPQPDGKPRADIDPALVTLRNSLRRELGLSAISGQVRWIRPLGGLK